MISWDEFNKEFSAVLAALEVRRKRYLKFFYFGLIASVLLMYLVPTHGSELMHVVLVLLGLPGTVTRSDTFSLVFLASVLSAFLIFAPIYRYRGTNRDAAIKTFRFHKFSLKDEAYSRLFRLFGPFEFAPRGGVSLGDTRNSTLFAQGQLYLPEDFISGRLNDVSVKLCEANIAAIVRKKRISTFRGLLIVCDISEIAIKLRDNFRGRTVLIYDQQKNVEEIAAKYRTMKKFPLPDKFEALLEGYTTDMAEAQVIVTPELLECLDVFATQLQNLKKQYEHWDSKLAYATVEAYDYGKDKAESIIGYPKLPSEVAYDARKKMSLDLSKADPISDDVTSLNKHFQLEFYDDKFIITVPCRFDLFETDPLFHPALNDEDARLVYGIMQTLDQVTQHLNKVKI